MWIVSTEDLHHSVWPANQPALSSSCTLSLCQPSCCRVSWTTALWKLTMNLSILYITFDWVKCDHIKSFFTVTNSCNFSFIAYLILLSALINKINSFRWLSILLYNIVYTVKSQDACAFCLYYGLLFSFSVSDIRFCWLAVSSSIVWGNECLEAITFQYEVYICVFFV